MFPDGAREGCSHRGRHALVLPPLHATSKSPATADTVRLLVRSSPGGRAPPAGHESASWSTRPTAAARRRGVSAHWMTPRWTAGWSRRGGGKPWISTPSGTTRRCSTAGAEPCGVPADLDPGRHADRVRESFNRRFWFADVATSTIVDGEGGEDDTACRPESGAVHFARLPGARPERWRAVMDGCGIAAHAGRAALAGARHADYRRSTTATCLARERPITRHGLGLADRPFVVRGLAHPEDHAGARRRSTVRESPVRGCFDRSARFSTPKLRILHADVSPRPGAWRKCCAASRIPTHSSGTTPGTPHALIPRGRVWTADRGPRTNDDPLAALAGPPARRTVEPHRAAG